MINRVVLGAQDICITKQELEMSDAAAKEGHVLVIVTNEIDLVVEKHHAKEDCANDAQRQL